MKVFRTQYRLTLKRADKYRAQLWMMNNSTNYRLIMPDNYRLMACLHNATEDSLANRRYIA